MVLLMYILIPVHILCSLLLSGTCVRPPVCNCQKPFVLHSGLPKLLASMRDARMRMLSTVSFSFALRVPSECIPMQKGCPKLGKPRGEHSDIFFYDDCAVLHLDRRKNIHYASSITVSCWCEASKETCPFHTYWPELLLSLGRCSQSSLQCPRWKQRWQ